VNQTGYYHDDVREWRKKPDADKTWANFKAHFLKAQEERNEEPTTANQAGYNAAAEATMAAAAEALANLATTNSTSTSVLQELTNQLSALTSKVEQLTTQNTELKATVQTLKSNRNPNNNQQSPQSPRQWKLLLDAWLQSW
jgi:phage shock protein A